MVGCNSITLNNWVPSTKQLSTNPFCIHIIMIIILRFLNYLIPRLQAWPSSLGPWRRPGLLSTSTFSVFPSFPKNLWSSWELPSIDQDEGTNQGTTRFDQLPSSLYQKISFQVEPVRQPNQNWTNKWTQTNWIELSWTPTPSVAGQRLKNWVPLHYSRHILPITESNHKLT